jgi:glycopeptide antibiotics resistance protein
MPSRNSDLLDLTLNTVGALLGVKIYFLLGMDSIYIKEYWDTPVK